MGWKRRDIEYPLNCIEELYWSSDVEKHITGSPVISYARICAWVFKENDLCNIGVFTLGKILYNVMYV